MKFDLTEAQFQALVGMLDVAVKTLGIRALEDDVMGVMIALKAAVAEKAEE
jgi:hypothetical protein